MSRKRAHELIMAYDKRVSKVLMFPRLGAIIKASFNFSMSR